MTFTALKPLMGIGSPIDFKRLARDADTPDTQECVDAPSQKNQRLDTGASRIYTNCCI